MSSRKTVFILVALIVAVGTATFFMNQESSTTKQPDFQKEFKTDFAKARKSLRQCDFNKAATVLESRLNDAENLKSNIQWKNGVSRWVYFHDLTLAVYESGKEKDAKKFARMAIRLYDQLALADDVKNIHTPPGEPFFEQMLENLVAIKEERPPSWTC